MRWVVLVVLIGCASEPPDEFDFHVNAGWSSSEHPEITSVTIDGDPVVAGQTWMWDDGVASYVTATSGFVKGATVTSAAGQKTSLVTLASCNHLDQVTLKSLGHLIGETDEYAIDATGALSWASGTCTGVDGSASASTRRERTR